MSNRTAKDVSKNILFVPLDRLKKSPKNVRKVPHTSADIRAFAVSIAALGMLQYPVVEPEIGSKGKPTGNYLVKADASRNCFASSERRSRPTSRSVAFSTPSTARPRSALPRTRSERTCTPPTSAVAQRAESGHGISTAKHKRAAQAALFFCRLAH
jgi:hypothetical protein